MVTNPTDTLGRLIDNATMMSSATPLLIPYGVWIEGRGWFANEQGRAFFSYQREIAETVKALWGTGATVYPYDQSLKDMEQILLVHRLQAQQRGMFYRLTEWFHSLWRI